MVFKDEAEFREKRKVRLNPEKNEKMFCLKNIVWGMKLRVNFESAIRCFVGHYQSPTCQRHFAEDVFKCIFMNEKLCIFIRIPLTFIPKGVIDDKLGSGNGLAPNMRHYLHQWWPSSLTHIWSTRRWVVWFTWYVIGSSMEAMWCKYIRRLDWQNYIAPFRNLNTSREYIEISES